jgi:hypothetical protein
MNVVLVHIGEKFPTHLSYCLAQLRLFVDCPVHLLVNRIHLNKFNVGNMFALEDLELSDEHKMFRSSSSLAGGFWQYATERFFYLHEYCKLKNLTNIVHIENDNLIFYDFTKLQSQFETRPIWAVFDSFDRAIPGFIYFRDAECMYPLIRHFISSGSRGKNDMDAIGEFRHQFPDCIDSLPIITNYIEDLDPMFYQHAKLFGTLFDAAAVGQYLGGLDLVCGRGNCFGFINETSVFRCDQSSIVWCQEDGYRVLKLNGLRLVNLHVHSKDLKQWMSDPTSNVITGERIQQLCDVYCGLPDDFQFNPVIASQHDKFKDLDSITEEWDNPRVIFCYGHRLQSFQTKMKFLKNPFKLVTHNSDTNITEEFGPLLEDEKLLEMYSQNPCIEHSKLKLVPIGIANSMWPHGNMSYLSQIMSLNIPKTRDVYFNFNIGTNPSKRTECYEALKSKFEFESMKSYPEYLLALAKCKFAICPEGNGIDSHRIWECYYLNVVPVLLDSVFSRQLKFPCVILESWADFNPESFQYVYFNLNLKLTDFEKRFKLQD